MEAIEPLIQRVVEELVAVGGVRAIVLGGSWAAGTQRPDSDVDFGLYYAPAHPLDIPAIRAVAERLNDVPNPVVTELGGWGRWVNGGSWLTIGGRRVDFIYRDLDFVSEIVEECQRGRMQLDYYQHPPYGFRSYIYLAETRSCRVLYDPDGVVQALKDRVTDFPPALRQTMVDAYLWMVQFALDVGVKFARRGEPVLVAGCMTNTVAALIQVAYALNESFFMTEKSFSQDVEAFAVKPDDFPARLDRLVAHVGATTGEMLEMIERANALFREMIALARDRGLVYRPRF